MTAPRLPFLTCCLGLVFVTSAMKNGNMYWVPVADVVCDPPGGKGDKMVKMQIPLKDWSKEQPTVITFYRTTMEKIDIALEIKGDNGRNVFPRKTIALVDLKTAKMTNDTEGLRRLTDVSIELPPNDPEEHIPGDDTRLNCEDFYLSDGRGPVSLPDTWQEAREEFKYICENEGASSQEKCKRDEASLFKGKPNDEQPLAATKEFCDQLTSYAVTKLNMTLIAGRRLKGGGSASGGRSAGNSHGNPAGSANSYGYSAAGMRGAYPRGVARTSYGYAGRSMMGRSFLVFAAVGAVGGVGMYSMYRYKRNTPNTECSDANCNEEGGTFTIADNQELYRDDLMQTGFISEEVSYGVTVTIYSITSKAFEPANICPPVGWTENSGWEPTTFEDLFISVSQMEEIEFEDNTGLIIFVVFLCLTIVSIVGLLICCNKKARHGRVMDGMMNRRNGLGANNPAGGLPHKVLLPGHRTVTVEENLGCCAMCGGNTSVQQGSVNYDLDLTPEGLITGRCNEGNGFASQVSGKMRWLGGQAEVHWLQTGTASGQVTGEVEGFICPGPNNTLVLRASTAGYWQNGDQRKICKGDIHCQTGGTGVVIGQVIGQ